MNYYLEVLKKYAVFNGRAPRKEYWYFTLFNFIVFIVLAIIERSFVLSTIYYFAVLIPHTAVGVRRLHDIGKSGWWLSIAFIPLIGAILLILDLAKDSQPGKNQYGSISKETKETGSNRKT